MNKEEQKQIYGCTRATYEKRIRSAVRKVWMISKGRKDALIRSRIRNTTSSSNLYWETCERCGKRHRINEKRYKTKKDGTPSKKLEPCLVVHHIEPIPNVFHKDFLRNMFCEQYDNPADGYKVVCNECHELEHEDLKGK